jgi:ribosomal protein L29
MNNQQLTQKTTQTILSEYADLRWQKAVIDAKLKEIEPIAITEALDIINNKQTVNHKQKVFATDNCEIIVQFRNSVPKDNEYSDLETLAELIEIEKAKAQNQNQNQIESIKQTIAQLQAVLVGLENTPDGLEFVAEYQELKTQLTTKQAVLAVKLI